MPDIKGAWIIFDDKSAARWRNIEHVSAVEVPNPPPDPPTILTRCLLNSGTAFNVYDPLEKVVEVLAGAE